MYLESQNSQIFTNKEGPKISVTLISDSKPPYKYEKVIFHNASLSDYAALATYTNKLKTSQ